MNRQMPSCRKAKSGEYELLLPKKDLYISLLSDHCIDIKQISCLYTARCLLKDVSVDCIQTDDHLYYT